MGEWISDRDPSSRLLQTRQAFGRVKKNDPTCLAATQLDEERFAFAVLARDEAQVRKAMPIADLSSGARVVIRAARKELQPAAGERERLEALLVARIGVGSPEGWLASDHSPPSVTGAR
jgi:hypothetical protein